MRSKVETDSVERLSETGKKHAHLGQALSLDDPGKDRALPPLHEEPDADRELLLARSVGSALRRVRQLLQYPVLPRSLLNLIPSDVYRGRGQSILKWRDTIRRKTIQLRRRLHHL
jgi:hypothetical protein